LHSGVPAPAGSVLLTCLFFISYFHFGSFAFGVYSQLIIVLIAA
jgi:hypothetical protein